MQGPFDYDDTSLISDPDGLFPGEVRDAIVTNGQMRVGEAPTLDEHVVRFIDIGGIGGLHTHITVPHQDTPTVTTLRDALIALGFMSPAPVMASTSIEFESRDEVEFEDRDGVEFEDR
jgi:hypothetical protein